MIKPCRTEEDFQELLRESAAQPVFLMKHSTRCPISARAHEQFARYADRGEAPCWQVLVIEDRPLSQQIAAASGVEHQSPQVILFKDGRAVWHASHSAVTETGMAAALRQA